MTLFQKELFTLLVHKAAEGVKVRALFDGFGNSSNNRPLRRRHLDSLRARGIEIYEFDPIRFPYLNHIAHRDHRKIVVIDGQVAYTGGMNVADYYIMGKPEFGEWRDLHTRVEGDAVGELQKSVSGILEQSNQTKHSWPTILSGRKRMPDRTSACSNKTLRLLPVQSR